MGVAGEATEHPSDLTKVPGRIIERRMVRVFSFRTFLTEECFEMVHYAEPGKKPKWGYFPSEGHPDVVTSFEGTRATPEFLQAIAYEVYVKNVTFGLLHQWLTDMGMTISKNTLRNWLKKGKTYLDELVCVCLLYTSSANAHYIVTNDHHYDVLKDIDFPKVNIVNIQQFCIYLSQEK